VVVRLEDNAVLEVNKQKMVKPLVGELAQVDGEVDLKKGRVKLQSVNQVQSSDIPEGSPARQLLDVRNFRANDAVVNRVRHELAMMPYISEFDFISFTMAGDRVILTGWTVRMTNRQTAYNLVKAVEGVGSITNNIQVLPMGASDMRVRATARARLGQFLSRYFWGSGSDIKIIVKNGNIILLGTVATEGDKDTANIQCNTVPGAFQVFNLLRVQKG
jgi:osmotically-inducible protein OsmY